MSERLKELKEEVRINLQKIEEDATQLSLDGLKNIKGIIGELEVAIKERKEKKKVKTISIDEDIHYKVKTFCAKEGVSIGDWTEKVLLDNIKEDEVEK